VQVTAPVLTLNVPAGQRVAAVSPGPPTYDPAGAGVQATAPVVEL
jgi:hypothetical protein